MAKRLIDVVLAALGLIVAAPLVAVAAAAIRLASPGPIFYRARRIGRGGRPFIMYKLRTMHQHAREEGSVITAADDPRVFPLGSWLRRTKVDELPQLLNVLRGEMAIVGPRPEDPHVVAHSYPVFGLESLAVRPGLASPGSLYATTHGEALLDGGDPETLYAARVLPIKLALDVLYVRRASLVVDARIIGRTLWVIAARLLGRRRFPFPPEMADARRLLAANTSVATEIQRGRRGDVALMPRRCSDDTTQSLAHPRPSS
jgi:lipopolysaccharide/colanic/teichoic acid biosynthesis glycosyltransferase